MADTETRLTLDFVRPLYVDNITSMPSTQILSGVDLDNERVLNNLNSTLGTLPQTGDPEMDRSLHYLDMKLDLLVELLGRIQVKNDELPAEQAFALSAATIYLNPPQGLDLSKPVTLKLYLSTVIPLALTFFGQVEKNQAHEIDKFSHCVDISWHLEKATDPLERFIFVQHRREFAISRHKS